MQIGIPILLLTTVISDLHPEFIERFDSYKEEVRVGDETQVVRYRLFVPQAARNTRRKFPLIVWLHGYGEHGSDNINQLMYTETLIVRKSHDREESPFFLLAVQCPPNNGSWIRWEDGVERPWDMLDATKVLIEQLIERLTIDEDRVCVTGVSAGGTACWEFAMRYPEIFAAAAPLGSVAGGDLSRVHRLVEVPVWAFHSSGDSPQAARLTVQGLKDVGGVALLTELKFSAHNCWTTAYNEYHLLSWLLTQQRSQSSQGISPELVVWRARLADLLQGWKWWQVVAQIGVPAAVAIIIVQHRRRRRLNSSD